MVDFFIDSSAIKIACIQTVPGYEGDVKVNLENACEASPGIQDFVFLKGLGSFDIILIYETKDFSPCLRIAGPIDHIVKSNLLLCYSYLNNDSKMNITRIFESIKKYLFTSFCFVKISHGLKKYKPETEKLLSEFISQKDPNLSLFGSLGWNELIILKITDNIQDIFDHISSTESIYLQEHKNRRYTVIPKTLSFIGINYKVLPSKKIIKNFKKTELFLRDTTELNKIIKDPKNDISPTIDVICKNIYLDEIQRYFLTKGFKVSFQAGKSDILAIPKKKGMKWSHFLASILSFRFKFRNKIFSTNTRIGFELPKPEIPLIVIKNLPDHIRPFYFEYPKLEEIFGSRMASNLANQFYTLNALFQNQLYGNVYEDMSKYPDYVYGVGATLKKRKRNNKRFALISSFIIRRGAELRSYGTFETIEEVTGNFSEFKGGCQLSLTAMELFPSIILKNKKLDIDWMGFITVTGEPQFSHVNGVINVTSEALWNPKTWWALYHEIAHIIIERKRNIVNDENPLLKDFLFNRDQTYYDDVIELVAEVIGFELGLFGNYDLYFKLLWEYLTELDPFQEIPISSYALRSFFIEIFEGHFTNYTNVDRINKADFDLDILYDKFVKHMNKIESWVGKKLFENKYYIAAQNVKMIKELYPFCKYLSKEMSKMNLRPNKHFINSKNTLEVMDALKKGQIWWDKIDCPQAIIYHIFQIEKMTFYTQIATLLSLWNQQKFRYRKR